MGGGFLFGYDTGVVSGAMLLIEDDPEIQPNTLWKELIVSATVGAAWLFALIGGPSNEYFGRKPTILMASVIFTAGAVVMAISNSKEILLVGRLIVGAGIGLASMSVPMYISEASPPKLRGLLVSCNTLIITFGQFVAAVICGLFSQTEHGWKWMLGLAAVPSAIQFCGFIFMPESPRWLVSKGKIEEAKMVLRYIRSADENPDEELHEIQQAVMEEQEVSSFSNNTQAIWMSAGVASVNFFCTFIGLFLVERIGRRKLLLASLLGVTLSLAFLAVGFQLADTNTPKVDFNQSDSCGQYSDCSSCTFDTECGYCYVSDTEALALNASCVKIDPKNPDFALHGRCSEDQNNDEVTFAPDYCPSNNAWLIVLGLVSYLFFFAPGMGPMPWTINSEIYPLWARSLGNSLATSTNWAFNLLISMTFLTLTETITKQGAFYLYTGVALLGFFIFLWLLPETKGKSLEEVEQLFAQPTKLPCNTQREN